jgi:hypothetical protein
MALHIMKLTQSSGGTIIHIFICKMMHFAHYIVKLLIMDYLSLGQHLNTINLIKYLIAVYVIVHRN